MSVLWSTAKRRHIIWIPVKIRINWYDGGWDFINNNEIRLYMPSSVYGKWILQNLRHINKDNVSESLSYVHFFRSPVKFDLIVYERSFNSTTSKFQWFEILKYSMGIVFAHRLVGNDHEMESSVVGNEVNFSTHAKFWINLYERLYSWCTSKNPTFILRKYL